MGYKEVLRKGQLEILLRLPEQLRVRYNELERLLEATKSDVAEYGLEGIHIHGDEFIRQYLSFIDMCQYRRKALEDAVKEGVLSSSEVATASGVLNEYIERAKRLKEAFDRLKGRVPGVGKAWGNNEGFER